MGKLFFKSGTISFLIFILISKAAWGKGLNVQELNNLIQKRGKRWTAGETSKSLLNNEDKKLLCGLKIQALTERYQHKINETEKGTESPGKAKKFFPKEELYGKVFTSSQVTLHCQDSFSMDDVNENNSYDLSSRFDWREKDGQNWTTPIRDQGKCGSCWAFASLSVMEVMAKISLNDPSLYPDYSEQFMLSCSEGDCTNGWYLDRSAEFLRSRGVSHEECFPYQDSKLPCEDRCLEWESQIMRISDWNWVSNLPQNVSTEVIKRKLLNGPLVAGIKVYEDFIHYDQGVYEHVTGEKLGDHAIVIVGWNDEDNCWICRNSWGEEWGESGWFRIKMGKNECGIEQALIFYSPSLSWDCDFEENFETKSSLPVGWEIKNFNPRCSWKICNNPTFEGDGAISIEFDPNLDLQDEVLMSSEIKGEDLTVSFAFMGSYYWGVEEDHYQVSLWLVKDEWDAGTTDDILITEDILEDSLKYEDESWVWWPVSYHLPEEIGNTKVRLAFRYQGRDGAQFCLDKICIKGFQGENNKCSLDVNEDGQITPHDALCIYERSLNQCPTSCGSCEDVCCDVDNNGKCSSSDASFVFEAYLKGQVVY